VSDDEHDSDDDHGRDGDDDDDDGDAMTSRKNLLADSLKHDDSPPLTDQSLLVS